jgi:hypothetical protein
VCGYYTIDLTNSFNVEKGFGKNANRERTKVRVYEDDTSTTTLLAIHGKVRKFYIQGTQDGLSKYFTFISLCLGLGAQII